MHHTTEVGIRSSYFNPETKPFRPKASLLGARRSRDGVMAGIYLVEDDPATLRMVQLILESRSHAIVGTATNAPDAKAGIAATGPDLCIIDISLEHGTSGIDVAEFVIEKIGCPVIIMSGEDQPTLPVPFLLKPVSPRRLIKEVERHCQLELKRP